MSSTAGGPPPAPSPSPGHGLDVVATDEQSAVDVDVERLVDLAGAVLDAERVPRGCELALRFVDEEVMAELNQAHMAGEGPTDVLAFPIDGLDLAGVTVAGDAAGVPVLLGDVVICPAVAQRNAGPGHAATADELALLVVHGILHVLGMDHADPEEAAAMQARQQALLADLPWGRHR